MPCWPRKKTFLKSVGLGVSSVGRCLPGIAGGRRRRLLLAAVITRGEIEQGKARRCQPRAVSGNQETVTLTASAAAVGLVLRRRARVNYIEESWNDYDYDNNWNWNDNSYEETADYIGGINESHTV